LNRNRDCPNIKPILDALRAGVGHSEFGLRVQGLFAHALLEIGGTITEVNQQGHPDVKWVKDAKINIFQIKSIFHNYAGGTLLISPNDIAGICPSTPDEVGYFAVLDCAFPISWVISEYNAIRRHQHSLVSIESIRATANPNLSMEISRIFMELVTRHQENLQLLSFRVLRDRALRCERL
jgi:hypothetical protein